MVIYPNDYSNFRTIMEVIMKNKWLLCILLMLFLPFGLFAQVAPPLEKQKTETQEAPENNNEVTTNSDTNTDGDAGKTIKGVINDEQGETIIGASVIIKGEDTGTTSDMDGRFTLEAPEGAILVISYIGYHTQEVKVRKRSLLRVVLKEDNQLLDEVVVVGYGTVKKSDLTGAVSGVSNRQYKNQPVQRVENILQGRTPGVEVTATSGMPGASMKVRVRGTTSINKSSDPLYVIDGIISSSGLDGINPSDIQSMEILKDASSTAIYGSRGSNGVILITTKQGSEGKAQVTFDASIGLSTVRKQYDLLNAYEYATALNDIRGSSTISAEENMLSFFGRVNYTMMDKYLLTVTVRADGSSKFGDGNRWGVFPSAALAWRISDEAFMANTKDWLSALKLRLSFGTAGNNRINSGLLYTTYSLSGNDSRNPFFNGTSTPMLEHGTYLYNPKLKWETTVTRKLGIDYGFWNNRISGSVDVYWNTTRDLLMKAEIPGNSGYSYQYQNFGQTSNKGIEMSMDAVLVDKKNFSLNFTANVAYNRNRIDKLTTDSPWQSSNWAGSTISKYEDFRVEEGGRLGEVWGFRTNGYYTVYDPVTNPTGELVWGDKQWVLKDGMKDNSPTITGGSYYPGGLKIQTDENGNPLKQRLGNTVAPWVGGFGLNGRFGNSRTGELDVNIFFNYSTGNVIINGTKLASSFRSGSRTGYNLNNDFRLGNRYTWIDPETGLNLASSSTAVLNHYGDMQAAGLRLNEINSNANMYNPAAASTMQLIDYAVEDASFLRLNNLTIGYSLPKHLVKKAFLQNVRVYLTGYNLFCWTSYSGADPEVDVSSKRNAMTPGVDYAAYPKSRTFVGGINITF